uniref:C3H1-type domain-containing protein n=2 Tax=Alexandrium monilatum TaxID=311494 RepID=A0A7S4QXH8_9DINO
MSTAGALAPAASEAPPSPLDEHPATPPRSSGETPASSAQPTPTKPSRWPRGQPSRARDRPRADAAAAQPPGAVPAAAAAPVAFELAEAQKDRPSRPQENAVTARLKKTKMCYFFERGKCASQNCRYAHSAAELRNQPNLQKTKLCKVFAQDGLCMHGENCVFAHGEAELRVTEGIYKTQMCHFFERGRCLKGERCNHAHGLEDLRGPSTPLQGAGQTGGAGPAAASASGRAAPPEARTPGGGGAAALDGRRPLSPLPLADLLADSAGGGRAMLGTAAGQMASPLGPAAVAAAAAAGLMTPEMPLGGLVPPAPVPASPLWGMPWPIGNPYGALGSPGTPMPCLPSMPSPGGLASPLPHGLGGLAPGGNVPLGGAADSWAAESGGDPGAAVVPCDLSERLASLDMVVQDLRADVRALTGSTGSASAGQTQQRHIHRI